MSRKFYITTAIDYVNSKPHLGTAYEKITADTIARYKRLMGYDTFFLMGNDEHSINVKKRAAELAMDPLDYCDMMEEEFRKTWNRLNISFDDFVRTSQERHIKTVQEIFDRIDKKGDIYKGRYEGWYCISCEAFIQEKDMKEGNCPTHEKRPLWIQEENYFFRLSSYRERIQRYFEENPRFLMPETRKNEVLSLIEQGLEDISISRPSTGWGIPVPSDPKAVIYVWFDALINYISGVGFYDDREKFEKYWPADLHIIGKDITRFHSIIWPSMLMSAGIELPIQVFGHGWVNLRGEKMSKSLGTAISPIETSEMYGADALRFFLMREIIYGKDGDFSFERFEERYNTDLANDLGNLVSRVFSMVKRYREGRIRRVGIDPYLCDFAMQTVAKYIESMEDYHLEEGINSAFELVSELNMYVQKREPWNMYRRGEEEELDLLLYNLCEGIRFVSRLLYPFMPQKMTEIYEMLGLPPKEIGESSSRFEWSSLRDTRIGVVTPLFPRIRR